MRDFKKLAAESLRCDFADASELYDLLTPPKDSALGDYCLPCFKFAKTARKPPAAIAAALAADAVTGEAVESVEAVGGYVNIRLNKTLFQRAVLEEILKAGAAYGSSNEGAGKTVCIDYSSVNIAKPFHMGHLLNTAIGGAIYRLYKALGYRVVGINHLGDWGTQFGKLIVAFRRWGDRTAIEAGGLRALYAIYVRYHEEAKADPALDDQARAWFKRIEDKDAEATELFEFFKRITLAEVAKVYERLHADFDSYAGESFYNDKMQPVLEELKRRRLLEESDGAQIVRFAGDEMPPCLLVRADGATLYATRDLAAAFYRKQTYDFDKCLYVVAYQQNLHFRQVFKVLEMMGCDWSDRLVHVAHGMVSLEDGAMSTRDGQVVFLEDVLNEAVRKARVIIQGKNESLPDKDVVAEQVGVGAVVFGMLYNARIKDVVFTYDKFLNFDGETAPYVQYTYARCCSVLEKGGAYGETTYAGLDGVEACELTRLLARFGEVVRDAAEKYEPSILARYAVDVAQAFNKFYIADKINVPDDDIRSARLRLTEASRSVLGNALRMLGISAPQKM